MNPFPSPNLHAGNVSSKDGTTDVSALRNSAGGTTTIIQSHPSTRASGNNLSRTRPPAIEEPRVRLQDFLHTRTTSQHAVATNAGASVTLDQLRQIHALSDLLRTAPRAQQQVAQPPAVSISGQMFPTTSQIHRQQPLDPLFQLALTQGSQLPSLTVNQSISPSQLEQTLLLQRLLENSQPSIHPSAILQATQDEHRRLSLLRAPTTHSLTPTLREAAAPLSGMLPPHYGLSSSDPTMTQSTIASLLQAGRPQLSLGTFLPGVSSGTTTTTTGTILGSSTLPNSMLEPTGPGTALPEPNLPQRPPVAFPNPTPRKRRRYNHESFPQKLHRLLTESHRNGTQHIARFVGQGGQFEIVNVKLLEDELMPRYFRTNKATSLKRLMRMYGFRKIQGRWMEGVFQHELFHREYPEMARTIQRTESPTAAAPVAAVASLRNPRIPHTIVATVPIPDGNHHDESALVDDDEEEEEEDTSAAS